MGYCNADCEYLTTRHNCKKYKKGLTYSKFSSRSVSTGAIHERCSECDKDHWIAELEDRINHRWIPVKERLPIPIETVLTSHEDGGIGYSYFSDENGWFCAIIDEAHVTDVVAWMPLPGPYQPAD